MVPVVSDSAVKSVRIRQWTEQAIYGGRCHHAERGHGGLYDLVEWRCCLILGLFSTIIAQRTRQRLGQRAASLSCAAAGETDEFDGNASVRLDGARAPGGRDGSSAVQAAMQERTIVREFMAQVKSVMEPDCCCRSPTAASRIVQTSRRMSRWRQT